MYSRMTGSWRAGLVVAAMLVAALAARADLVGCWQFTNDANPQPDSSGYNNNAGVSNNVVWTNWFDGRNGVMKFGGAAGDHLEVPHAASLSLTGDLTIATWVWVNNLNAHRLVCKTDNNYPAPFDWSLNAGHPDLYLGNGIGQPYANFGSASSPGTDATLWRHIVVTMSGTNVTHYLDGLAITNGGITVAAGDKNNPVWIGSRVDGWQPLSGYLDDVAIWNQALSSNQVRSVYLYGATNYNLSLSWPSNAYIIKPVDVLTAVDPFGGNFRDYHFIYAIDGSGLSDMQAVQSGKPVPTTWPSHGIDVMMSYYSSTLPSKTNGFMLFDLGAVYPVYGLHVWNGNRSANHSLNLMAIDISTNGTGVRNATNYTFTALTSFPIAKAPGNDTYRGMDYIFNGGCVTTRYVRLNTLTTYDNSGYQGAYQSFSEIRFVTAPGFAVPETGARDYVVKPTAISVPTEGAASLGVYAIDGSGLDDASLVNTRCTVPATWPSHTNDGNTAWMTTYMDLTPTAVFDLGSVYPIRGFHLWNMNWCGGYANYYYWVPYRSFRMIRVSVTTNGTSIGNASNYTTMTTFPPTSVAVPMGYLPYRGDDCLFANGATPARFVKIECLANWRDDVYGSGIAEIRFIAQSPPSGSVCIFR